MISGLLLCAVAWISGCSTTPQGGSSPNTWLAYNSFKQVLENNPQTTDFRDHLASNWTKLFESADGDDLEQLKNYVAYPVWLSIIQAHYQKPIEDDHCLLVNGIAFDESPGTVSVRYVIEEDQMKASEIHYQYWEVETEFPEEARCPNDFVLDFPVS